jgi:hypothetical protein
MSINEFMKDRVDTIRNEIIGDLPDTIFDSHDFIKRFARKFETDYVQFLGVYRQEPFKTVHGQIAKFLSENKEFLRIKDDGKVVSPNIFGDKSENENWIKY